MHLRKYTVKKKKRVKGTSAFLPHRWHREGEINDCLSWTLQHLCNWANDSVEPSSRVTWTRSIIGGISAFLLGLSIVV